MDLKRKLKKLKDVKCLLSNWPVSVLDYWGLYKGNVTYRLTSGEIFSLIAGTDDLPILLELYLDKPYFRFFEIKKDDIVIDIGAHKGIFTIQASKVAKKVISYEPSKDNFRFLFENMNINKLTNVRAFNCAVSNESRERFLFKANNNSGHSLIKEFKNRHDGKEKVSCISLSEVFENNKITKCDFLKMDCEGSEHEILINSPKYLLKKIINISIESHDVGSKKTKDLELYLKKNNYLVNRNNGYVYASRRENAQ